MAIRVSYKDAPDIALTVHVIHTWRRGDIEAPIMSSSSGPKDYVKNKIFALFESNEDISAVVMLCAHVTPFLLRRIGNSYFDATNQEVIAEGL